MFLRGGPLAGATRWRFIPAHVNGQLAFGAYTELARHMADLFEPPPGLALTDPGMTLRGMSPLLPQNIPPACAPSGDAQARRSFIACLEKRNAPIRGINNGCS